MENTETEVIADGPLCCDENMVLAPSGICYECLKCGNWTYSSS